jgi:hypothetical protein
MKGNPIPSLLAYIHIKAKQLGKGQLLRNHDFLVKKRMEVTAITFLSLAPVAHFLPEVNIKNCLHGQIPVHLCNTGFKLSPGTM